MGSCPGILCDCIDLHPVGQLVPVQVVAIHRIDTSDRSDEIELEAPFHDIQFVYGTEDSYGVAVRSDKGWFIKEDIIEILSPDGSKALMLSSIEHVRLLITIDWTIENQDDGDETDEASEWVSTSGTDLIICGIGKSEKISCIDTQALTHTDDEAEVDGNEDDNDALTMDLSGANTIEVSSDSDGDDSHDPSNPGSRKDTKLGTHRIVFP